MGKIIFGLSALLALLAFWPGFMSADTFEQFSQALRHEYSNWHPPLLSWFWGLFLQFHYGPGVILVLQVILLWWATWGFTKNFWVATGTLLFLPILALTGTLWKDVWFVIAMLALAQSQTIWWRVFFAFVAVALRHNAWPALVPFFLFIEGTRRQRAFIFIAVFAGLALTKSMIEKYALGAKDQFPIQQILAHDLLALSLQQDKFLLPEIYKKAGPDFTKEELKLLYNSGMIVPMYCCSGPEVKRYFPLLETVEDLNDLKKTWFKEVSQDLRGYAKHRLKAFNELMGLGGRKNVCNPFHQGIEPNQLGFATSESAIQKSMRRVFVSVENSLLFRGWVYFLIACVLIAAAGFGRLALESRQKLVLWSGLFYVVPYYFVSTTCDFRMTWWMTFGVVMVSCQLLWQKVQNRLKVKT